MHCSNCGKNVLKNQAQSRVHQSVVDLTRDETRRFVERYRKRHVRGPLNLSASSILYHFRSHSCSPRWIRMIDARIAVLSAHVTSTIKARSLTYSFSVSINSITLCLRFAPYFVRSSTGSSVIVVIDSGASGSVSFESTASSDGSLWLSFGVTVIMDEDENDDVHVAVVVVEVSLIDGVVIDRTAGIWKSLAESPATILMGAYGKSLKKAYFIRLPGAGVLTICWTNRAITESLVSMGLIGVNGGERTLRRREERSIRAPLKDSSASVLINVFTTVVTSVLSEVSGKWPEGLFQWQKRKRVWMFCATPNDNNDDVARVRTILVVVFLLNENVISKKKLTAEQKEGEREREIRTKKKREKKERKKRKKNRHYWLVPLLFGLARSSNIITTIIPKRTFSLSFLLLFAYTFFFSMCQSIRARLRSFARSLASSNRWSISNKQCN